MTVEEYIYNQSEIAQEWLLELMTYVSQVNPYLVAKMSYGMPMFVLGEKMKDKGYFAFSIAKGHFTFHVHPQMSDKLLSLNSMMPKAKYGKACIKINFKDKEYQVIIKEVIRSILKDI